MTTRSRRIMCPEVKEPSPGTWSNCKVVGDQFFVAGLTAHDLAGGLVGAADTYSQAKTIFTKMKSLVTAAGAQMDDIVKLNIYVTDMAERENVWKARTEFFSGDFPTCALVQVSGLAIPALTVEIEAVGFIGSSVSQ